MKTFVLNTLALAIVFLMPGVMLAQAPNLGTASSFALFTSAGAFNADGASTVVTGDVGTNVGAFNAFPPGTLVGAIHIADPVTAQAATDLGVAYGYLDGLTCGSAISTSLGSGQTLAPNIYCLAAASTLNGNLTLDAGGNPDALFIFQIDGALSSGTFASVTLTNSASLCNVYWQVNGAFNLGEGSVFRGTVIANGAITLLEESSVLGRALSIAGAIDLHSNSVTLGAQPAASTITASGATTFCDGGSVTLSGNTNSGTWSTGATTTTITTAVGGDFYVTNTSSCGSINSNHITVIVNSVPTPTFVLAATSVCLNSTGNIYSTQPGMSNYQWTISGGTITAGGTTPDNTATTTWTTEGTQSISVNYTDANGCTAANPTVQSVQVNPLPTPTFTTAPTPVCLNTTGNVYTTQAGMSNYQWTISGGVITAGGTMTDNTATATWTVVSTGTISVNYSDANGCSAATSTVSNVEVNPQPDAITGSAVAICRGNSVTLGSAPIAGNTYLWTPATGLSSTSISNPVANPTISTTYTLTETITATNCQNTNSVLVTVNPIASIITAGGPVVICEGQSVVLSGNTGGTWNTGATTPTITVTTSGDYFVTNTDACGSINSNVITVLVNPIPNANAGPDQTINACVNTQLTASSTTDGVSFSWTASGGGNIVSGANSATITVDQPGPYTVTVTIDATGCTSSDFTVVTSENLSSCINCNGNVISVNSNVTVNFNTTIPTYTGPAVLQPFFSYSKVGTVPSLWKAIFNVEANRLLVNSGVTIKTTTVNGFAPGIVIAGTCDVEVANGGHVVVNSSNKNAGDILFQVSGNIIINGEVRNQVSGTLGLPGAITFNSTCGYINVGSTGTVQDLGTDFGGNNISLQTCGADCIYGNSDITLTGLIRSYAHAHAGNLTLNRPNIKVVSLNGSITINANSTEPLFDEYSFNGTLYDLYGGLLSWVRNNVNPGKVEVQAAHDIVVNGHGTDPTGPVRRSFGAITAVATASDAPGGLVDVRSIMGRIIGDNRSFDVSGRNRLSTNFARIRLWSASDIVLTRSGGNANFNPVVDASSPGAGDRGGTNELRSYSGGISIGTNALVSAAVPAGNGSVQGVNLVQSCTGITNNGSVVPADLVAGDDGGSCSPSSPAALYTQCILATLPPVFHDSENSSVDKLMIPGRMLMQNAPNPFATSTAIAYNLPEATPVRLIVYDLFGRVVVVLVDEMQTAGYHSMTFNSGSLTSGLYSYRLQTSFATESMMMMLSR